MRNRVLERCDICSNTFQLIRATCQHRLWRARAGESISDNHCAGSAGGLAATPGDARVWRSYKARCLTPASCHHVTHFINTCFKAQHARTDTHATQHHSASTNPPTTNETQSGQLHGVQSYSCSSTASSVIIELMNIAYADMRKPGLLLLVCCLAGKLWGFMPGTNAMWWVLKGGRSCSQV